MSAPLTWWGQAAEAALDLAVPQQCAGCGRPGRVWCRSCEQACIGASLAVPLVVPCRAACDHAGPAGRAVVAFKDQHVRRLARPLADLLAVAVVDALADARVSRRAPVWVVPVPSRRSAVRARGADHTSVLAGRAARLLRRTGVQAHRLPALTSVRASRDQVGLTRGQRRVNVEHTMQAHEVPSGVIVLVDDVSTTGATLNEGIRALGRTGRVVSCAATVTWSTGTRRRASTPDRD